MDIRHDVKEAAKRLGIKQLRQHQIKPINSILEGHDTMVLACPSAGKSAIYQIPALLHEDERIIVIEPIMALMHNQVDRLQQRGIAADYYDSSRKKSEQEKCMEKFVNGQIQILFLTPERFTSKHFVQTLKHIPLYMVVVDECHCVLDWGYTFRQDYLRIGKVVDALRHRPILAAFTATATQKDMQEIAEVLHMEAPQNDINPLWCKNLTYIKKHVVNRKESRKQLQKYLKKYHRHSSVIYCNTTQAVDAVYKLVKKAYPEKATYSYAALSAKKRIANEKAFLTGEKSIMVATTAFGMGIDLDSVDLMIHFNMPLSLTDYMQQTGRAGRKGQKAHCVLLYCDADYHMGRYIISSGGECSARAKEQLDQMKAFCDDTQHCMAQLLMEHFEQTLDKTCKHCTICQKKRREKA